MSPQRFSPTIVMVLILAGQLGSAQSPSEWHKRYGQPEAERYALPNDFVLTVFYSPVGQTCKAKIEQAKSQSQSSFDEALNEILPPSERGKKIRSMGLSNVVGFTEYERVTVSLYPVSRESPQEIKSAVILWHGVACSESDRQDPK